MPSSPVRGSFRLLLHDVQSAINLGMILRVAETFGVEVEIWDPRGILEDPEKIGAIADFSCGAFARHAYRRISAPVVGAGAGRFIATCLREDAVDLDTFAFRSDDLVAVGNEYDGLPEEVIGSADVRLRIPMPPVRTPKPPSADPIDAARTGFASADDGPVLSTAMAAGILCYAGYRQQRAVTSPGESCW